MTQNPQHQQHQQQPFGVGGDYAERLVRVERDVAGLKEGMAALGQTVNTGFANLTNDLKARSGINWAPISILVTVLGLVGSGFFAFLSAGQGRLEASIAKQEVRADRFVPREDVDARFSAVRGEADTRFSVVTQRRDDLQRLTDARIERVERDGDALAKQVVPRGEHEQTWAGQRARDEGLQRQIDALRQDLSSLNTPRDTIQAMQRRIEELDRTFRAPGRVGP